MVDPSVRVGLAEITWSFFSRTRDTSKKTFLANPRSLAGHLGSRARGAEAELDEAWAKGWTLVME